MPSAELKPIILYDIPCTTPGVPWSPNTMKTRYCLGYKGLPFTTVWVELPDIVGLLQSKGITHAPYTLPAIEDPNTGSLIVDSVAIATYLDETYPETPRVLTLAARAAVERVEDVFSLSPGVGAGTGAVPHAGVTTGAGAPDDGSTDGARDLASRLVFVFLTIERLNPVSNVWYHQRRITRHGEQWTTLVDACSASPEDRAERVRQGIEAIRGAWCKVAALYVRQSDSEQGTSSGGAFALGEEPCFLDFAVAGRVKFVLNVLTPPEAETLKNLEGGRLGKLVEDLEKYFQC